MRSQRVRLLLIATGVSSLLIVGCGTPNEDINSDNRVVSEVTNTPLPDGRNTPLPDGVFLPSAATLVDGPSPAESNATVSGWSAVAVTDTEESPRAVLADITAAQTQTGWRLADNNGTGRTAATYRTGGTEENPLAGDWLLVTVSPALEQTGPVIAYRFAHTN
jgi:hypothetical protein